MMGDFVFYVDIDGVCVDFFKQFNKFYHDEFGEEIDINDVKVYEARNYFKKLLKLDKDFYYYLDHIDFYHKIDWFPGAKETLNMIAGYHNVKIKFITTCVTHHSLCWKSLMLQKVFPWYYVGKNFIAIDDKVNVIDHPFSIFVDDNPSAFKNVHDAYTICFKAPYNQEGVECDLHTNDWKEIYRIVSILTGHKQEKEHVK